MFSLLTDRFLRQKNQGPLGKDLKSACLKLNACVIKHEKI